MKIVSNELLELLICPMTSQTLSVASEEKFLEIIGFMNREGADNESTRKSSVIEGSPDGFLLNEEQSVAYPVVDGIPMLVESEAVRLTKG